MSYLINGSVLYSCPKQYSMYFQHILTGSDAKKIGAALRSKCVQIKAT